jgi:micrococcal nuclease
MIVQFITTFLLLLHSLFGSQPDSIVRTSVPPDSIWATTTGLVSEVIDGDTIAVRLVTGETVRVRYIGINTPEIWPTLECGGASSTARNRTLVAGKTVTLIPGPGLYDKYNRRLAYVYVGDMFVNQTLIAEGWASLMMIPPNTAYRVTFERLETLARSTHEGVWSCSRR